MHIINGRNMKRLKPISSYVLVTDNTRHMNLFVEDISLLLNLETSK